MLHPVAMRGCLHMLLPICFSSHGTAAAASLAGKQVSSCVLGTAAAQALQQLSRPQQQQQQQQASTAAAAGSRQICIQVDGGSPQLIVKGSDGAWVLQTDSSTAATGPQGHSATSSSSSSSTQAVDTSSSKELPDGSLPFGNATQADASGPGLCWLEPPVVLLAGSGSRPSTAAPYPTSPLQASTGTAHVTVHGLPAAAGGLVRVLLVQRTQVVSDQLLHTAAAGKQPHGEEGHVVDTLSVR
jgi:hypothetical protein